MRWISNAFGNLLILFAVLTIALGTLYGGYLHSPETVWSQKALDGMIQGFMVSGVVIAVLLGPIATLYDIRNNLRKLVEIASAPALVGAPARERIEPRLRTAA